MPASENIPLWKNPVEDTVLPIELCCYPLPDSGIRPAVLVIPGGGYGGVCENTEGEPIARRFNELGFHAFVLHYRVAPHRFPEPQQDVFRAIRLIRANAERWNVLPQQVAVCGFSAGGHLAASAGTMNEKNVNADAGDSADAQDMRPNALILCYPVISFTDHPHEGSGRNLLGDRFEELKEQFSQENRVTPQTPPAFLWHTAEDEVVPCENSIAMAAALRREGIPFSLHLFPHGPHGMLLGTGTLDVVQWPEMAKRFLIRTCGFSVPESA